MLLASIPSPSVNGFHVGPLFVHFYALMYIVGISLAVMIGRRRWRAAGGHPAMVEEVAIWGVPFGILGGRIYFDLTTPAQIPPHWWGPLAVWDGGLGIWGGVALATAVCVWRLRRAGASVTGMMDALAPCLLVASGIGRIGNYFNQELFGGPTSLPWGLRIAPQFRPPGYLQDTTFHPTFLYELIWDLLLAGLLVWLGRRGRIAPGGLFALYVAGYSAFRMFEETLRVDYSQYILGLRLNFYIASVITLAALVWFAVLQRRHQQSAAEPPTGLATGEAAPEPVAGQDGGGALTRRVSG
ncbi:prolipoprotein diacylglyceryl transferase [Streptacidiphilus sp. PB12-B1b]|uniref:prolipoprotein diacylglyceryl transferase n=1 Tax=Streptacidiphilus sp. PB12-B1b TaxID=2705012 RepID=UPI0015F96655|nr:prolipoprotein diacylglyceryl transferase [Streptacidiphilus sp. PB12-B1b]QMU74699.1 prolipoprotein diacylglyceryl transferase [Streptacidiphilus sp. PB12-B1b]